MILSGHQPVYLPGIILFNKIALSDAFMFVGHVQFSNKSWQQRNRIALNGRELLLTVPVKKADKFGQSIDETEIDQETPWLRKHLGTIQQAYRKAAYFNKYYPALEAELSNEHSHLGSLNRALILLMLRWLSIQTPIVDSHDYPAIAGAKTQMLIEMCRAVGADRYLSNEGSRAYVVEEDMARAGIAHCWQGFCHPTYKQNGPFVPNLSVIDLLFHHGEASGDIVRSAGWMVPGSPSLSKNQKKELP